MESLGHYLARTGKRKHPADVVSFGWCGEGQQGAGDPHPLTSNGMRSPVGIEGVLLKLELAGTISGVSRD